jgi:hypothetical protein
MGDLFAPVLTLKGTLPEILYIPNSYCCIPPEFQPVVLVKGAQVAYRLRTRRMQTIRHPPADV